MYRIIIVPAGSSANVVLFFRTLEGAEGAQKNIHEMQKGSHATNILVAKDDFGHVLSIPVHNVAYSLFIDTDKAQELALGKDSPSSPIVPRPTKPEIVI